MAKEKTFDQEIRQEIIPSFAPESKSDIHGPNPTYIYCVDCTVQAKWFGLHSSGSSKYDFVMTTEGDYHMGHDNNANEDPKPKKRGRPKKVDDDTVQNKRAKTVAGVSGKGKSKAKPKEPEAEEELVGSDDNKNDIDEHTVEICMYVNVETAPPPALRVGGRVIKAPAVKITPRGPFTFESNTSYANFLAIIAKGVVAGSADCLVRAAMQWRFDRPQNAAKKPVTNEMGYKVMITTLLTRPKDYSITISMPPPTKHVNDVVSYYFNILLCCTHIVLLSLGLLLLWMRMTVTMESQLTMITQLKS